MRFIKCAGLLIVLLLTVLAAPALAAAPGGINLTTSPLPISLSMNPGTSISTDVRVQNSSAQTQQIKVSLMKFSAYGETGKPALQDRAPGDDYFDWVSFSPSSFQAPPNQWMSVKMTIRAPKEAAFGYYYAVVFTPANQVASGQGNKLVGSTAVLVLLDVKNPNAKRQAQIADFSVDKKIYEFLPVDFSVRLHNTGNVHLLPAGSIFIKRGSKQVAAIDFNTQHGNVLPNSYRVYTSSWSDGFPIYVPKEDNGKEVTGKNGQPARQLKWDLTKIPHLKFGHYTANLVAAYDNGTRDVPLQATVSFWVVPWRIIAFVIVVGGLTVVGLWSTGGKIYRRLRGIKKHEK